MPRQDAVDMTADIRCKSCGKKAEIYPAHDVPWIKFQCQGCGHKNVWKKQPRKKGR